METPDYALSPRTDSPSVTHEQRAGAAEDDDEDDYTDVDLHDAVPSHSTQPLPPPPPPPPPPSVESETIDGWRRARTRYRFEVPRVSFVPSFAERQRIGEISPESLMPESTPDLLHRLSLADLSDIPIERSVTLRTVIRECEAIALDRRPLSDDQRRDLRRLLCTYDDYALKNRPRKRRDNERFTRLHQLALFLTTLKIVNVLDRVDERDYYVENHYNVAATTLSDAELALWMFENNACHPGMLVVNSATGAPSHRLQSCSLECFWQTMLSLMAAWPTLPMSAHLVRFVAELRRRCAFFVCYREYSAPDAKRRFDENERKILGLNASLFALVEFDSAAAGEAARANGAGAAASPLLLDNFNLAAIGDDGYVVVNTEFVDQCESILHHMRFALRQAVGFVASPLDRGGGSSDDDGNRCALCKRVNRALTPENLRAFEQLVDEELRSTFRSQITEEFRSLVMNEYLQPSEMAEFAAMHEREVQTALNCISRQRQADFRRLSESLLLVPLETAWEERRAAYNDPAYACLAEVAVNFHLQRHYAGAEFHHYFVRSDELRPFSYINERFARRRNLFVELHTPRITTGTLKYRARLLQQAGLSAPAAEANYEHPLVLKTLNGFDVVYNGHTHRAESFAHAFLHWLATMCTDTFIRGTLPQSGASLSPLYARLFPERAAAAADFDAETARRLQRYNPVTRMIGDAELEQPRDARTRARHTNMSQF